MQMIWKMNGNINPITTIKWSYLCELVVGQEPIWAKDLTVDNAAYVYLDEAMII